MNVSCEVQPEDSKAVSDKNKKRRLKTPAQVHALEKFYSEHKYPSEELKSQFAVSIGLTEKQISGWFCHRRLKDKRSSLYGEAFATSGRQDRSSDNINVLEDHDDGHRVVDSCGSTKEGGIHNRHFDQLSFREEVQSSRGGSSGPQNHLATDDLAVASYEEHGLHHHHDDGRSSDDMDDDDTSSGSSFALQHNNNTGTRQAYYLAADTENVAARTINTTSGIRTRPIGRPSGYLKVKKICSGRAENPAITAVKRQLGRQYCEDGPPLSVEFDPLPPGAFESLMHNNPVDGDEPGYLNDADLRQSSDVPQVLHRPDSFMSCGVYSSSKMSPCDTPHLDVSNFRLRTASRGEGNYIGPQCNKQKHLFSGSYNPSLKKNSTKLAQDISGEMPIYDKRRPRREMAQHDLGGRKDGFNGGSRDSWFNKSEDVAPEQVQRDAAGSKYLAVPVGHSESFNMENRRFLKRIAKADMLTGETSAVQKSSDSLRLQGGRRVGEEFVEQTCGRKATRAGPPLWTNQTRR